MEAPAGLTCCQVEAESISSDWVQGEAQLGQTRAAVEDGCPHGQGGVGPRPVGRGGQVPGISLGGRKGRACRGARLRSHCL